MPRSTNHERVALDRLSQAAAAKLISLSARTLRDATDAPRNDDGTYSGPAVVEWAATRREQATLTDQEHERALAAVDAIEVHWGVSQFLLDLEERHGDAGLLRFVRMLLDEWRPLLDDYAPPSAEELRQREKDRRDADERHAACERLDVAVVCDGCGRLRCGPRWRKQAPPRGHAVLEGVCPKCQNAGDMKR